MLTQGPTQDPNNKLNISSFGTFPVPLDCLIYASNIMIIVFLLHMTGHGKVGGWFIYVRVWLGSRGWVS